MKIKRYCNIGFGILGLVFFSCATPGRPTGGPRDETPPVPVYSSPENFSTHFDAKTIAVKFDENIVLKNLTQQLTVSPPMAKPDIYSNNRNLTIRLQDTLRPNSTYVISFGDALVDNNEGNILPNYQYVFSTGSTIDSLSVVGEVLDAYTLEPRKEVGVALLSKLEDLGSKADRPVYIARADKDGYFQVKYLREGCYFLAAIKDENSDWTYDSLQEEVAFLQTCVSPKIATYPAFPDSCSQEDSLQILDSIRHFYESANQLLMFKQELPQGVNKSEFIDNAVIQIEFKKPVKNAKFRILQPDTVPQDFRIRWDKNLQKADLFLSQLGIRNMLLYVGDGDFSDTLKLLNTKFEEKPASFRVSLLSGQELAYFDTLKLAFSLPIREINQAEQMVLYSTTDTLPLTHYAFDTSRTQLIFEVSLKQKTNYELMIPDSLFVGYFGQLDTNMLRLRFKTNSPETYAKLDVKLKNKPEQSCIIQVLNEKFELVQQQIMTADTAQFPTLKPGKYRLRLIIDENSNSRWDAGNLREQRLSETVFILPKILTLEPDWEYEEEWEL